MKIEVDSTLLEDVQKGQPEDEKIKKIKRDIKEEKSPGFTKKMTKLCCGTKEGFVCLTSRN
jgi:hypothetical protein